MRVVAIVIVPSLLLHFREVGLVNERSGGEIDVLPLVHLQLLQGAVEALTGLAYGGIAFVRPANQGGEWP